MTRLSHIAMVSHMRKLIIPVGKESKNSKIRQVHATTFGFVDPVETPEGKFAGITKSFSLMALITDYFNAVELWDLMTLLRLNAHFVDPTSDSVWVYVAGKPFGCVPTSKITEFIDQFKRLR